MPRVTYKRKYTDKYPSKKVNKAARVRNQVIEFVARNGEVSYDQLCAFIQEVSKSPKGASVWLNKKSDLFNIKEDESGKSVSLSKKGTKIYDSVMTTNESELFEENEDKTFLSFEEFSAMNKEKNVEDDEDDEEEEEEDDEVSADKMKKDPEKKSEDDEEEKNKDKKSEEDDEEEVDENLVVDESNEISFSKSPTADQIRKFQKDNKIKDIKQATLEFLDDKSEKISFKAMDHLYNRLLKMLGENPKKYDNVQVAKMEKKIAELVSKQIDENLAVDESKLEKDNLQDLYSKMKMFIDNRETIEKGISDFIDDKAESLTSREMDLYYNKLAKMVGINVSKYDNQPIYKLENELAKKLAEKFKKYSIIKESYSPGDKIKFKGPKGETEAEVLKVDKKGYLKIKYGEKGTIGTIPVQSVVESIFESNLRSVKVHYKNKKGEEIVMPTAMAADLTDDEIKDYFKKGKTFNLGTYPKDNFAKVTKVEIIK